MSDLISRKAAIDAAIEAADDWDGGCNIGRQKRIEKYIRRLPSAEPHWIPVTEEPIPDGEYLVTWTSEIQEEPILSIVCRYSEVWDCWELQLLGHHDINILAYMPLPEPYKVVTT